MSAGNESGHTPTLESVLDDVTSCVLQAVHQNVCHFPSTIVFNHSSADEPTPIIINLTDARHAVSCHEVSALPLLGIFTGIGFIMPVVVTIVILYQWTKQLMHRHFVTSKYENLDGQSSTDQPILEHGHLQAFKDLMESRAKETKLTKWINDAANPLVPTGFYMNIAGLIAAALSFVLYLSAVSVKIPSVDLCGTMPNAQQILDWFLNLFLLAYLLIRVYGRDRKLRALICGHAWVDYFTLPAALVVPFLDRYLTGYGFLRSYSFLWLVEILAYKGNFRIHNTLKLTHLVFLVIIILFVCTGFLHLFENKGDFYSGTPNGHMVTYWECFLYLYGRITLIDLSGMKVLSVLGKVTTYLFQLFALGTIGRIIPQIVALIKKRPDYDQEYVLPDRFLYDRHFSFGSFLSGTFSGFVLLDRHVILAGQITNSAVNDFLREFFHADRPLSKNFQVAVMGEKEPDELMNQLMKKYFMRAEYKRGSVMSVKDLAKIKLNEAAAIVLLADRPAPEAESADSINLMRVISIKNFNNLARIIVQLIQFHNKAFLTKIPTWKVERGDMCICLAEFRFGLLAQSCRAPGISTLIANFFMTRLYDDKDKEKHTHRNKPWMEDYLRGSAAEMYAKRLSDSFVGWSFRDLCRFTYEKLDAILVAVKTNPFELNTMPLVNPGASCLIEKNTLGYFIARDVTELAAITLYCDRCHKDTRDFRTIKRCACEWNKEDVDLEDLDKHTAQRQSEEGRQQRKRVEKTMERDVWNFISENPATPASSESGDSVAEDEIVSEDETDETETLLDSTGRFHWCRSRTMNSVLLSRQDATKRNFRCHVIVCMLAHKDSPVLDLTCFALTLRSSAIKREDLLEIVVLCDHIFMEKEWQFFMNLPALSIVKGDPLNRADLRAINLSACRMCVILGVPSPRENQKIKDMHYALMDKSVILATVNMRDIAHLKDHHNKAPKPADSKKKTEGGEDYTDVVYQSPSDTYKCDQRRKNGHDLPLLTDIIHDLNVRYLDLDDDDTAQVDLCTSEAFAGGRAFSGSLSDCLCVTGFFNPNVVNVLRTIIFGGTSLELEKSLAEGAGLMGGRNVSKSNPNTVDQVIVSQYPLTSGLLEEFKSSTFGEMFLESLRHNRLCLGLFRKLSYYDNSALPYKRVVITKPPPDFMLHPSDLVFCLDRPGQSSRSVVDEASATEEDFRGPSAPRGKQREKELFDLLDDDNGKRNSRKKAQSPLDPVTRAVGNTGLSSRPKKQLSFNLNERN